MAGKIKKRVPDIPVHKIPMKERIKKDLKRNYLLYLMLLPGIFILICFKVGPVGAMVIAFQDFSAFKGILGSEWVGLKQFIKIFQDPYMLKLIKNTVVLAILSIVVVFPFPIIFSLFLNEVRIKKIRHAVQSLSFLPYFISSAIMVSILYTLVSPSYGLVNKIIEFFGGEAIFFMAEPQWFRPLYIILQIWQTFGYSTVIYIAAMMAIDTEQYEAADMDGANRWQTMIHIDFPAILPTVMILLIMNMGNILNVGFDKVFLMQNSLNLGASQVISTYVYTVGIKSSQFSFGAAVGLFNTVINFVFLLVTNYISKRTTGTGLM